MRFAIAAAIWILAVVAICAFFKGASSNFDHPDEQG
jgi:hypothetical protein